MPSIPKLGRKPEVKGTLDYRDQVLLEKTINRQVEPSEYGVILPPSFLRRDRTRSDIQYAAMCAFYQRLGIVCNIADDPNKKDADRLKAVAMLGQFGIGERVNVTLSNHVVIRVVGRILSSKFTDEEFDEFMDTLKLELERSGE
jgi:hypothetical protein